MKSHNDNKPVRFSELESKFGFDNADALLKTMEQLEGIQSVTVKNMSREERLENVFRIMTENLIYQTRH